MPVNTSPIFGLTPKNGSIAVTAANVSSEGEGTIATNIFLAYTAGSNGSFIRSGYWVPTSTASTATTATIGRVFYSSQTSGATTNANTTLLRENTLASQTAGSTSAATFNVMALTNYALQASQTLLVTNQHAPAANSQWKFVVEALDY